MLRTIYFLQEEIHSFSAHLVDAECNSQSLLNCMRYHEGEGSGLDAQATLQRGGGVIVIGCLIIVAARGGVHY